MPSGGSKRQLAATTRLEPLARGTDRRRRPRIYLFAAQVGIMAAGVGFGKTFFSPLLNGTFSAPPIVYVHGACLFG
jgi:hypothetical protein